MYSIIHVVFFIRYFIKIFSTHICSHMLNIKLLVGSYIPDIRFYLEKKFFVLVLLDQTFVHGGIVCKRQKKIHYHFIEAI